MMKKSVYSIVPFIFLNGEGGITCICLYTYIYIYINIYIYLWELSKALMLELETPRNFFAPILVPNNLFFFLVFQVRQLHYTEQFSSFWLRNVLLSCHMGVITWLLKKKGEKYIDGNNVCFLFCLLKSEP